MSDHPVFLNINKMRFGSDYSVLGPLIGFEPTLSTSDTFGFETIGGGVTIHSDYRGVFWTQTSLCDQLYHEQSLIVKS